MVPRSTISPLSSHDDLVGRPPPWRGDGRSPSVVTGRGETPDPAHPGFPSWGRLSRAGGRLVEDQDAADFLRMVRADRHRRAASRARELESALADLRIVALRQALDEAVNLRQPCRSRILSLGSIPAFRSAILVGRSFRGTAPYPAALCRSRPQDSGCVLPRCPGHRFRMSARIAARRIGKSSRGRSSDLPAPDGADPRATVFPAGHAEA